MSQTGILWDTFKFMDSLPKAELDLAEQAETELEVMANRIADRMRRNLGIEGPMMDAIGVERVAGYIDVGVLPDRGPSLTTGGDARPSRAATAREYGHDDHGVKVPPYPFARPAIAEEIQASGGTGKLPAFPAVGAR